MKNAKSTFNTSTLEKILASNAITECQRITLNFSKRLLSNSITIPASDIEIIYNAAIATNVISNNNVPMVSTYVGTPNTNAFTEKLMLAYKSKALDIPAPIYLSYEMEELYNLATIEIGKNIDDKIISQFSGTTDHERNKKYIKSLFDANSIEAPVTIIVEDVESEEGEENPTPIEDDPTSPIDETTPGNEPDDEVSEDDPDMEEEFVLEQEDIFTIEKEEDVNNVLTEIKNSPKIDHEHKEYGIVGKIMKYSMKSENGKRGELLTKLLSAYATNTSVNESLKGMSYSLSNNNAGLYINENSELDGKPVTKYTLTIMGVHSSATSYKYESIAAMFSFDRESLNLIEKVNGKNERYYKHSSGVLIDIACVNKTKNSTVANVNLIIYDYK